MTRDELRVLAISHTLFPETTLVRALARLGFVQADPIRAPAPAQDLVLRHRVRGYRVGDLERRYAELALEEDYLYAYGFLARGISNALHPRPKQPLGATEKRVLAIVRERGAVHPKDLDGSARVTNAWGGQSRATTHALERLHRHGLLRVARRNRGVRVYAPAPERPRIDPVDRLSTLVRAIAEVLSPIRERTLRANVARFRHLGDPRAAIDALTTGGALTRARVDGADYLTSSRSRTRETAGEPDASVRFLAPFDPLVWDRRRFEHLFGWAYRFEAYTPIAKRIRGYYALPLLYRGEVIGWANISSEKVEVGFVTARPREPAFKTALDEEIVRLRTFASSG